MTSKHRTISLRFVIWVRAKAAGEIALMHWERVWDQEAVKALTRSRLEKKLT